MKLVIKNEGKVLNFYSADKEPNIPEDKAKQYDYKKLQQWESNFDNILLSLSGTDKTEGMRQLFELAEEGYPEARRLLSDMYLKGQGVPESFEKALEWDRRAKYAEGLFRDRPIHN